MYNYYPIISSDFNNIENDKNVETDNKKIRVKTRRHIKYNINNPENILLKERNIKAISKQSFISYQSTSRTDKNNENKKDLIEGAVNFLPIADTVRQEQAWKKLRKDFYPDLGASPEEEKIIFLNSLNKVTQGLSGKEKSKAVLLHIVERFKATGFTYGRDIDTEELDNIAQSVAEVLADRGKDIDCEDFSIMADFWLKSAIEAKYLPKASKSFILCGRDKNSIVGHAVAVYQDPEGDTYIIDGTINSVKLLTFNQYKEFSRNLDYLYGEYEYTLKNKVRLGFVRKVSEKKLSHESDFPLDKSISNINLKKKIYARHDVAPDPYNPVYGIHDYPYAFSQYENIEFYKNKFESTIENPMVLLPNTGSAIAEGAVATFFALYKRQKASKRIKNIITAYNVKKMVNKNSLNYSNTVMSYVQFKSFSNISFLIDNNYSNKDIISLAQILSCHKSYQTAEDCKALVEKLIKIFPNDTDLQVLKIDITEENIANAKNLGCIQTKLKKYGIAIKYQKLAPLKQKLADKFRKQKNEKSRACMHKVIINKKIFYNKLKNVNKLQVAKVVIDIIQKYHETIDILYKLKNYDDWKLSFLTKDGARKVVAAITGFIPLIPIDELVRTCSYVLEENYRVANKTNMEHRVKTSLNMLQWQKQYFTDTEYTRLLCCLNNLQELKIRHIELKQNKLKKLQVIHLASGGLTLLTDITGPIGIGARNATKGAAKVTNSIYFMVRRYQGDKKQKQKNSFNTAIDVYKLYKDLYIKAKESSNEEKQNAILILADESFDLEPDEFKVLVNTSVIENKQFKLSFSRPIGCQARVSYYMYNTKL
jgi:transcription elongation factor Elf1